MVPPPGSGWRVALIFFYTPTRRTLITRIIKCSQSHKASAFRFTARHLMILRWRLWTVMICRYWRHPHHWPVDQYHWRLDGEISVFIRFAGGVITVSNLSCISTGCERKLGRRLDTVITRIIKRLSVKSDQYRSIVLGARGFRGSN